MAIGSDTAGAADPLLPYEVALLDWLACACAGAREQAAKAVSASGDDLLAEVAFVGTAGHALDFDDTFADGVAHVSAACAPAALVLAAHLGLSLGASLDAYAEGYETMATLAAAAHPSLYDAGWHPTAVCGPVGAAVVASRLLDLPPSQREHAVALAMLRTGGTRGAFGSDGKAIQVGLAAAAGVQAALLARAGATVAPRAIHGPMGFEAVFGVSWPDPASHAELRDGARAIQRNWIKLHPSCLGTHSPIDSAAQVREDGSRLDGQSIEMIVHPLARQAAHLDLVDDGLSAKFSIPYCVAHTLTHGAPVVRDFAALDPGVRERSRSIKVAVDEALPQFGAVLTVNGSELACVPCPRGAPGRPATQSELADKLADLAGERLDGVFAERDAPAANALSAAGLRLPGLRPARDLRAQLAPGPISSRSQGTPRAP